LLPIHKPTLLAGSLLLAALAVNAQNGTPVRSFSVDSTLLNPSELDAQGEARRQPRQSSLTEAEKSAASSTAPAATVAAAESEPLLEPWWEGMEVTAEHSIRSSGWRRRSGVGISWVYDENFALAPRGSNNATQVYSVSPFLSMSYGEPGHGLDFQFEYSPEYSTFSDPDIDAILNHSLSSSLGLNGARSRVLVSAGYNRREGGNVEVGGLVSADVFNLGLSYSYDYSPKTSFGAALSTSYSYYSEFNSFANVGLSVFADYSLTAKTRVGFGMGYDLVEQQNSRNQNAVNANLRLSWAASSKTSVSASLGGEFRSFEGGDSIATPNGTVAASYAASPKLSLQLSLYRRATTSIVVQDSIYYATGGAATASYNLSGRSSLTLGTGYELAPYQWTDGSSRQTREDKYLFVRSSLSYSLRHDTSLSLFYQWSHNDSNSTRAFNQTAGFRRSQMGASLSYSF
jgi:hypothetical protein